MDVGRSVGLSVCRSVKKMSKQILQLENDLSEQILDKLGLSWAKLSHSWGLKIAFQVEDCKCSLMLYL